MGQTYSCKMSLDEWVSFFVEFVVPDDVNAETVIALLKHIVDLGAMVQSDDDKWLWVEFKSNGESEDLTSRVQIDLESLSGLESGFALPYFIGYKNIPKKPLEYKSKSNPSEKSLEDKGALKGNNIPGIRRPASDLSNLQIVKKVGKQLQPFLQLEESVVSRLIGKHVGKQDAQKLFHYMFGKVGAKAEPRVWEQLSRKRHR